MATEKLQARVYFKVEVGEFSHGILGVFVFGSDGHLYAVTAKHVAGANGRTMYYINDNNEYEVLGKSCHFGDDYFHQDIGMFRIDQAQRHRCSTYFTNIHGCPCKVKVFAGTIDSLYGEEIFVRTSIPKEKVVQDKAEDTEPSICDIDNDGAAFEVVFIRTKVAPKEVHNLYSSLVDTAYSFLVVSSDEFPLIAGDSGSALFLQNEDGSIELVGVLGGKFTVHSPEEEMKAVKEYDRNSRENNGLSSLIICTILKSGLGEIGKVSEIRFSLTDLSCVQRHRPRKKRMCFGQNFSSVFPGVQIFFLKMYKTPEGVKPTAFDFTTQIVALINGFGDEKTTTDVQQVDGYIAVLTDTVYSCEDKEIPSDKICWTDPDHVGFYKSMCACKSLYSYDFKAANEFLREAYRAVIQAKTKHRLLAKLIMLVSYMWLNDDALDQLGELYEVSTEFMASMDARDPEMMRYLGYYNMNFACYHDRRGNTELALELGWKSWDFFHRDLNIDTQGPGLSCVLLARLLLGCGEYFTSAERYVSEEDIDLAAAILNQTVWNVTEIPILRALYCLAVSELHFRQGRYRTAVLEAQMCLNVAQMHNIGESARQARAHIAGLRVYVD